MAEKCPKCGAEEVEPGRYACDSTWIEAATQDACVPDFVLTVAYPCLENQLAAANAVMRTKVGR